MKTKKVNLNEFKEILKKIIKEEIQYNKKINENDDLSVKDRRIINDLKKLKYTQKEAEDLIKKYPNKNASAINSIVKELK
jgi:hypothetical protein